MKQPKSYFRGNLEVERSEEFLKLLKREFPEIDPEHLPPVSRRRFVQLLGASASLAAATGCRWEDEKILTFNSQPENRIPGVPQRFATTLEIAGVAAPLLVTSYDGRPIKVDGNPDHPLVNGTADVFAQASILGLYDPDRSQVVVERSGSNSANTTFDAFVAALRQKLTALRQSGGAGLAILTEETSSDSVARLKARIATELPKAMVVAYEPVNDDDEREGSRIAFGKPMRALYDLAADVVVTLDADLLGAHPMMHAHARSFASRRNPDAGSLNRLYAIESNHSTTGAMADHRLALRPSLVAAFVQSLAARLGVPGMAASKALDEQPRAKAFVEAVAKDLLSHKGRGVVAPGRTLPPAVAAHVHRINAFLENASKTVKYVALRDAPGHAAGLRDLVAAMNSGAVRTLLVLGGNPVYTAPADLAFADAMKKVETTVHLGLYADETAAVSTWHVPQAHYLEAWNDARAYDGTPTLAQPLIAPLYGGKTALELLSFVLGDEGVSDFEVLRATFKAQSQSGADALAFESAWRHAVHDGFVKGTSAATEIPALAANLPALPTDATSGAEFPANGQFEITFVPCTKLFDGRFANNGWLQELPDFMTKTTWDNAALIAPGTAKKLGLVNGQMVKLSWKGRELEMAAYLLPGHAHGCVTVALGYGRDHAGVVGGSLEGDVEPVGFNTYALRPSDAMSGGGGLTVDVLRKHYEFAMVQDHHMIDTTGKEGRQERLGALVREADVAEYAANPDIVHEHDHVTPLSLWKTFEYEGLRWGMAIDLSKCTGCNACVMACQSENNLPIVGKEMVRKNREMHWIRIDRYFSAEDIHDDDDVQVVSQPLPCQQCENAPCEQVCPVGATMHSSEGLNDMVYNRCVGTRYCSNNCPYKVRRFNYFNYHEDLKDSANEALKMAFNPEVTVRARGVMEKCTYCVQRIQNTRITAKNQKRPIKDGEIVTACQQTCPAQAITFGDLNDQNSMVSKEHASKRSYSLLSELNSRPRTAYLARIRNPNPELVAKA
ncbi:MAG: TAT-variant-translocated molybdopterin oxidoreductase [Planctomycetes bacterium]|nr:TAT-variant-translocated molybdopterin oxidoreductase [Planctomycetota bacterium]MCC7171740.1 TAT-variant-translocated molybdopterin oxidoreductase [Planctomycetota bacterium]